MRSAPCSSCARSSSRPVVCPMLPAKQSVIADARADPSQALATDRGTLTSTSRIGVANIFEDVLLTLEGCRKLQASLDRSAPPALCAQVVEATIRRAFFPTPKQIALVLCSTTARRRSRFADVARRRRGGSAASPALNQQAQQHPGMIQSRTRASVSPAHPAQVETVDHFDDEPSQVHRSSIADNSVRQTASRDADRYRRGCRSAILGRNGEPSAIWPRTDPSAGLHVAGAPDGRGLRRAGRPGLTSMFAV